MLSSSSMETRLSLISRVRGADTSAWREFVQLYGPLIRYWCRSRGLESLHIDDCVQDVFLAVLRSLDLYDSHHSSGSFRGWLWTMTKRKVIDCRRRQQRQAQADGGSTALNFLNQLPEIETIDDEQTSTIQLKQLLYRAMQQVCAEFEAKTWKAFERCVVDGQATETVARELSLTPAAVRQYRARVLRRLRRQLGDLPPINLEEGS